jgi:hypothetical protein
MGWVKKPGKNLGSNFKVQTQEKIGPFRPVYSE